MNNEPEVRVQRRTPAEIEQIVAEFASSGLNRTQFCKHQHLNLGTLNRYLNPLRKGTGHGATNVELVAVEVAGTKLTTDCEAGRGLALVLSGGRRIEVGAGFDAHTLERLINLLEKM